LLMQSTQALGPMAARPSVCWGPAGEASGNRGRDFTRAFRPRPHHTSQTAATTDHISVDEAFKLLRGYARSNNRMLGRLAGHIISGNLAADALTEPARNAPA
jgi:hypothetical protein